MLAEDGTLGILVLHVEGVAAPCKFRLGLNRVKQRAGSRAGEAVAVFPHDVDHIRSHAALSTFLLCFARPQVENVVAEHHLVSFTLLTILIGQGHISKVVIVAQIFKAHPYHSHW